MTRNKQRILALVAGVALVLVAASPAAAQPVDPIPNDGFISMTERTCGTSAGWLANAQRNGAGTAPYWVWLHHTYDIQCVGSTGPQPKAAAPALGTPQNPIPATGWVNPVPGACITSGYGWRGSHLHRGVDLGVANGTPVRAAHAGTVYWGNDPGGAGWYIMLNSGGIWTAYFHLSQRLVANGQTVATGQVIARSGGVAGAPGAGNSTGPHLHFEVHPWGEWVKQWSDSLGAYSYTSPVPWMSSHGVHLGC